MAEIMLQLGAFQFSVDNAAYQTLTRSSNYNWSPQSRIGTADALQFTGLGRDSIGLRGIVYPEYKGGDGQIDLMRLQALVGVPLPLVSGQGRVLGLWVMEGVRETQAVFGFGGLPRRQEFDLRLRRYDGGLRDLLPF